MPDLTPEQEQQAREIAVELLLDHARDVEFLTIVEHLGDEEVDDPDDDLARRVDDLIRTATVSVELTESPAPLAEVCGEVGTSWPNGSYEDPAYTEPCALPPGHDEDHDWAQREAEAGRQ